MKMENAPLYAAVILLLILAACGPAGPVLGLGPALDPFVGLVLLLALALGGFWVVKTAVRSPAGQAIERQVSETGQAVRDHFRAGTDDSGQKREHTRDAASPAEEILRQRYARGEIDRKQYLEMMADLKQR